MKTKWSLYNLILIYGKKKLSKQRNKHYLSWIFLAVNNIFTTERLTAFLSKLEWGKFNITSSSFILLEFLTKQYWKKKWNAQLLYKGNKTEENVEE